MILPDLVEKIYLSLAQVPENKFIHLGNILIGAKKKINSGEKNKLICFELVEQLMKHIKMTYKYVTIHNNV